MGAQVAVVGASGYAGGELLRLLAGHPALEVAAITAHASAGEPVTAVHPHLDSYRHRTFGHLADADADLGAADLVFLALPPGESGAVAAGVDGRTKVVDLGADHRAEWAYGLPELPGQRERIVAADRVAAAGCYVTATAIGLAPLIAGGLAAPDGAVVTGVSGTSGAGRAAKPNLLGTEVMGDLSAYSVGGHRHVPEMCRATGARSVAFTPVLAPMPRGILASITVEATRRTTADAVRDLLTDAYGAEPFVRVLPDGTWPRTSATLGSNACHLQATVDASTGRIIVVAALDNLGKGAAGQAVQCANLTLGLPETTGLPTDGTAP